MGEDAAAGVGSGPAARGGGLGPGVGGLTPVIEPDPALGQVVVTRFECGTLPKLLALIVLHVRVKRQVRRHARGLVASRAVVQWRRRTLLSVSLWEDLQSIYSMGNVTAHVGAAGVPHALGVRTAAGVFCFAGDWRRVLFQSPLEPRSPLRPLEPRPLERKDRDAATDRARARRADAPAGRTDQGRGLRRRARR
ncbi:hypothetical protein [Actinomadura sp. NPDC000600]|uniref:hypothetical protein n=1 Tax=Actinomadura sp. NPDC000600 TaxID=3154262 RepID=UPI00339B8E28